ncbi:acyloxyacyl hydrolase [Lacinutrix iliipiscaria]|uniref:Acyloxyacyl hydrolase n=1 Tax=Lacinutrix iliipiscaria TaxID=1230532 RepID=A0ABW5WS12_9FLAO
MRLDQTLLKTVILPFFLISTISSFGQDHNNNPNIIITPEILFGITGEANTGFPDRELQKQLYVSFGFDNTNNQHEWSRRFKAPRTGLSLGLTDFGNTENLGYALSLLPFIEFNAFKNKHLKVHVGTGISYFNKVYDPIENPNNKAVSSHFTWAFRLLGYYSFSTTKNIDWRVGLGYAHHSNGHIKLPNQGFNSFLLSVSADLKLNQKTISSNTIQTPPELEKSSYRYFTLRSGYGESTLSNTINSKKDVYTFSGEYGKVYNNIYKLGIGFYYRFYKKYYDYIKDNESLVQEGREFEHFKKHPVWNASNIGLSLSGEILLNHIGIDVQIGFNLFKPAYKIDWRINEGWENVPREIPENSNIVLGEFDTYFKIKHIISSRLGFKYYMIGTEKQPKNNIYIGAFINGNLGQADFTELAIGYVHKLN